MANAEYSKQWRIDNREKRRAWKKKYYSTDEGKLKRRNDQLVFLYGISLSEYDVILEQQGFCCSICKATTPGKSHKHFSVDHDHETGKIRGLLCNNCNRGLGLLGDNIEKIKMVLNYLQGAAEYATESSS